MSAFFEWLDTQPVGSVLYVSLGSFLSVSSAQMGEIVAGIRNSRVRYFWEKGGGFWTHCGLNSIIEGLYAAVPVVTFPIFSNQVPNSERILENWKIRWRVKKLEIESGSLVIRDEITQLVKRAMDLNSDERKGMSKRAKEVKEILFV
ncbi:hypothetical protein CICLE_v10029825mg [Citrus x clementina]|uniref:Uncharacterized protein n=1 Tax=Citrus clementina TaxID=85681 RepID=V4UGB8_CITCL|nr:hypothetical protein CICLE_v10029825mg [Citrus x clementina]